MTITIQFKIEKNDQNFNIPFSIQKIAAKNAGRANGIPNQILKKTGQISDQEPDRN